MKKNKAIQRHYYLRSTNPVTGIFLAALAILMFGNSWAQSDAWVLGDQWVSLQDPNGQLEVNDLPTGADYNGQIAAHSQAC